MRGDVKRRERERITTHFHSLPFTFYLSCHGSNLAGRNGPTHDVVFQTGVLEIPQIRHSAPNPLLVLVTSVPKLAKHT